MPSLKDLRLRIASVKATQKITKAMQMVAAAKLRRAQAAAEAGLCGAFNSSIARLARDHALRLMAEGKTVQFFCVGRKGADILRRQFAKQIVEVVDLRGVRQIGFQQAEDIARRLRTLYANGAFDVATIFFGRFRSVIAQI